MNSADQAVNEIWEMGVNLNPGMYYDSGHILTADVPPKKRVWVWVYIYKLSVWHHVALDFPLHTANRGLSAQQQQLA